MANLFMRFPKGLKKAVTLIENANNILEKNSKYFEASEIESIKYYLDVMDYILYTKIYE